MVGAKEFSMRRTVGQVKKTNPVLAAIRLPKFMKSNESELDNTTSLLNNHKREPFSLAKMMQKPAVSPKIDKSHNSREESNNEVKKPSVPRTPFLKEMPRSQHKEEDKDEDISDELANRITCKVLKNIKNYLNSTREMGMGNKHIKLEISL